MDSVDILVSMGIAAILQSIKNPKKQAQFRAAFLKVFRAIKNAYAGDPDFA